MKRTLCENKLKKIFILFLVLAMTTTSFAAAVSDNDGAAFITKAEFDSLKNQFQTELNSYNTTLDDKIDSAISAYIAGISVSKTSKLRSSLEVAGQTYQGVARKSYVFAGNSSAYFMCRYNYDTSQFVTYGIGWNKLPNLRFTYKNRLTSVPLRNTDYGNGLEMFGIDQLLTHIAFNYIVYDDDGNQIENTSPIIFIVDKNNYVTGYKFNAEMQGRAHRIGRSYYSGNQVMAMPFMADSTHHWTYTFKDIVGANGTNGMGYSTRALGDSVACTFTGYRYYLFTNESSSRSGWVYLNKTMTDNIGTTRYIMQFGSSTEPYSISQDNYGSNVTAEWLDTHLHFEESRFGESYAWCMPFGHLLPDRKASCFSQWPAWESVNFATIDTQNLGAIMATTDKIFSDTSGSHHWAITTGFSTAWYLNGLSKTYFSATNKSLNDYVDFNGMLPIWVGNPLKDWRLLKNNNIHNALDIDAFYAAAPPLTAAFSKSGSFTWVAKVNQQDVERIPGRTWSNWGNTRIYFTKGPMNDIEYSGTNVKVSNTKKFQYKKHGTTNDWADCSSQVLDGKTYYYLTLDHDTYYDFKMDVDTNETVYYMIFDEKRPDDYCLEVIEHPDYQIEFTSNG